MILRQPFSSLTKKKVPFCDFSQNYYSALNGSE